MKHRESIKTMPRTPLCPGRILLQHSTHISTRVRKIARKSFLKSLWRAWKKILGRKVRKKDKSSGQNWQSWIQVRIPMSRPIKNWDGMPVCITKSYLLNLPYRYRFNKKLASFISHFNQWAIELWKRSCFSLRNLEAKRSSLVPEWQVLSSPKVYTSRQSRACKIHQ